MKNDFRKKVISIRKNTSQNFINTASDNITNTLLSLDIINNSSTVMTYLDFNNEVKTNTLISSLINSSKNVLVPKTIKTEKKLIPSQIKNLDSELKIGTYGIREPKDEFLRIYDVKDIDVLIVPAVAFDSNKYRLGYGGGFYDRFIEQLRDDAITIGVAFEFQIFDSVPIEPHDAQMDIIVTESRIIK